MKRKTMWVWGAAGAALLALLAWAFAPRPLAVEAARATTDPYEQAVAEDGRVRRVEPAAFTKVSALGIEEQRVNVLIELTSPPAIWQALGDGYRVGVRIVTLSQPSVLRVPVSAVFPRADGGMAVFVVDAGRARLTPVELGGRNGSQAWVRGGIADGIEVIVYPPAALRDGMRLKVRSAPGAHAFTRRIGGVVDQAPT